MIENIIQMQPVGRLSLSRICFHCDLSNVSGKVIPLGAIAEITLGQIRGLGLIARTQLLEEEIGAIGKMTRSAMSNPFAFLEQEFDWAWANTGAGEALQGLADRHAESLFVSPPRFEDIRKAVMLSGTVAGAEFAREELRRKRDDEYLGLLMEIWGHDRIVPSRDMADLAA